MPKRQTIQEFVEKAQLLHGSKYDYSKVIYKDSTTEVIIGCPLHGPYLITPKRHIAIRHSRSESKPQGCPKCGEEKRRMNVGKSAKTRVKTSEQFIIDAKKVHGEKYCYKKALYKSAHSHVIITCKIHGDFSQKAYSHLNGKGCPECGLKVVRETANKKKGISMPRKGMTVAWNQETFIAKCTEIHRGKYYYTKTIFTTTNRNIIYECKKHGLCTQMASEHLRGRGCERCGRDMIGLARRMKFDQWEKIAKTTHGDQYEYDQASYKTTKHPIRIRCKIHGWFSQSAGLHAYAGIGCNQCGNESISESQNPEQETKKHYLGNVDLLTEISMIIAKSGLTSYPGKSFTKRMARSRLFAKNTDYF